MAPKSASKAQLLAKNAELEAANRKLEEEILALRPLLRVVEAQKNTIRCQQQVISSLQKANGGVLGADRAWDFDVPEKEAPQYGDFAVDPGEELPDIPRPGLYMVYTDGSCIGNGSKTAPGGWAAVVAVPGGGEVELSGGAKGTTNNRMELMAVCVALETLKFDGCDVTVYSDSKYVVDAVNQRWVFGWEKKGFAGKKNPDLWMRFLRIYRRHGVRFVWVKGHASTVENNRCDQLAVAAANGARLAEDTGYRPE